MQKFAQIFAFLPALPLGYSMMPDLKVPQFGAILLGATQLVASQGQDAFDSLGIDFDAKKISIVLSIHKHGPCSSSDLAAITGLSRQLLESRLKPLVDTGFLQSTPLPSDTRKRVYTFSDKALPVVEAIVEAMLGFEAVYAQLWQELGFDLEQQLTRFVQALGEKSLTRRYVEVTNIE